MQVVTRQNLVAAAVTPEQALEYGRPEIYLWYRWRPPGAKTGEWYKWAGGYATALVSKAKTEDMYTQAIHLDPLVSQGYRMVYVPCRGQVGVVLSVVPVGRWHVVLLDGQEVSPYWHQCEHLEEIIS